MAAKPKKISRGKLILNVIIIALIALVVIFTWDDIKDAWKLLGQVNFFILALLVPIQFFSYFSGGMIFFSYLKQRGKLKKIKPTEIAAISLEFNFMNHILPSAGFSGVTYTVWRLRQIGISSGQAAMTQIMRLACTLTAFTGLLIVLLPFVMANTNTEVWLIIVAVVAVTAIVILILFAAYLLGGKTRLVGFAKWLASVGNKIVQKVSFGRKKEVIDKEKVTRVAVDLYEDFSVIKEQKKLLVRPLLWALAFVASETLLFMVTFWALGVSSSFPVVYVAESAASVAGTFMVTPGGIGGYDATMVMFLSAGGMAVASATSGVLLTRVVLILGTLVSGYIVQRRTLKKYGKPDLGNN